MFNGIDASNFGYSKKIYEKEFVSILAGLISCYKIMIQNKVYLPNDENKIRDTILLNYLKKREVRESVNLMNFRFDREVPEDTTKGRPDIKIITKNEFENDDAYYIIECKRLNNKNLTGTSGLNGEYIKNGIMRFVNKKYSSYYRVNGMIGFVVDKIDIDNNIKNINFLLDKHFASANTKSMLTFSEIDKKYEFSYLSVHVDDAKKKLNIYHLMFDFSKNIK